MNLDISTVPKNIKNWRRWGASDINAIPCFPPNNFTTKNFTLRKNTANTAFFNVLTTKYKLFPNFMG